LRYFEELAEEQLQAAVVAVEEGVVSVERKAVALVPGEAVALARIFELRDSPGCYPSGICYILESMPC